jgi:hypothetical protein
MTRYVICGIPRSNNLTLLKMINSNLKITLFATVTLALGFCGPVAHAQTTNKPAATAKSGTAETKDTKKEGAKEKAMPYHGTLTAVDKTAKTITVGKRAFQITSQTRFYKGEKVPATLDDGIIGEEARLSYLKEPDGKFIAHNVYFGAKPDPKKSTTPKPAEAEKPKK